MLEMVSKWSLCYVFVNFKLTHKTGIIVGVVIL